MPNQARLSVDLLVKKAREAFEVGVPAVALFPALPDDVKDQLGTESANSSGLLQRAVRALKLEIPALTVITDVALDPYSSDGHDGVVVDGRIDNELTLPILAKMAVAQAAAGADVVAPSDMMDGRVGAIRKALDEAGHYEGGDLCVHREVRLLVLRTLPRSARLGAALRRQEDVSDGLRERARVRARGAARRGRGRRLADGEAGPALPRRGSPRPRARRRCRSPSIT